MGVRHREFTLEGVQFHPESLMTAVGKDLLLGFLSRRKAVWNSRAGRAGDDETGDQGPEGR
jgi:hypothetical protein